MIYFKYPEIAYRFSLNPGDVVDLEIENPRLYRSLVIDLLKGDDEAFSVGLDEKELSFSKMGLVIPNLFDLDPNSKRILMAIYKKMEKVSLSPERQALLDEINAKIQNLLSDLSTDFEGAVVFNDTLSLPQLLGLADFKFNYDDSTFLSAFLSYLKAWREAIDLKIVFSMGLFSLLEPLEEKTLETELSYIGISLINIASSPLSERFTGIKKVRIDHDLCEIY
jgi:CRISPR type II-A-associated protein Csn2